METQPEFFKAFETERKSCKAATVGLANAWREFDRNPTEANCLAVMTVQQDYHQKLNAFWNALISSIPDGENPAPYLERIRPPKSFSIEEFHRQVQEFGRTFLSDTPGQKFKATISRVSPDEVAGVNMIRGFLNEYFPDAPADTEPIPVVTVRNAQDVPDGTAWLVPALDDESDDDTLNPDQVEAPTPEPQNPNSEASQPEDNLVTW